MPPTERRVDWEAVKACIAALSHEAPTFLSRCVLIGGGACWFYRVQLRKAADPEFKEPPESQALRDLWLSKDIDFTGIFRADAYEMLPHLVATDSAGNAFLQVHGVRIGFAQVGVTFDPEEVLSRARVVTFKDGDKTLEFLVIDPISLYREKQALAQKRNSPNDHAHFAVLREYLCLEFIRSCAAYVRNQTSVIEQQQTLNLLLDFKQRAIEISQDARVRLRLLPDLAASRLEAKWIRDAFQL